MVQEGEEKVTLNGIEFEIKIQPQIANALTGIAKKEIVLTQSIKEILTPDELKSALMHERGHHTWPNILVYFLQLPIGLGILYWILFHLKIQELLTVQMPLNTAICYIFISILAIYLIGGIISAATDWTRETMADRYSVISLGKENLKSALTKINNHNKEVLSKWQYFYRGYLLHPPICIRFWFIDKWTIKD